MKLQVPADVGLGVGRAFVAEPAEVDLRQRQIGGEALADGAEVLHRRERSAGLGQQDRVVPLSVDRQRLLLDELPPEVAGLVGVAGEDGDLRRTA